MSVRRVLSSCRIKQHPLPPTSFNFVQKCLFRLIVRTTGVTCTSKQFHSPPSSPILDTSQVAVCHAIHICHMVRTGTTKQSQEPTQPTPRQSLGPANRTAKSWNFKRERSLETPSERNPDSAARPTKKPLWFLCPAAHVLLVAADDCWNTPGKMMSQIHSTI